MNIVTIATNREEWEKVLSLPETRKYVEATGQPVQYVTFQVPFRHICVTVFPPVLEEPLNEDTAPRALDEPRTSEV